MAKRKKDLTPEELADVRRTLAEIKREVRGLIEFLQQKLGEKPA